ncbi:hypothetical protein [Streptomyces rubiginosohelvolus]|uniref:Uncharacterized protein n=1 Tax=Streptomyces rubiginosohelvolus TaxID=67362 RepID=A0ABW6EXQ2_9ACTN
MADAQIILAYARESGIVAIAHGEEHELARTALAETGFRRDDEGVYHPAVDDPESMVAELVTCAKRHHVTVHTSGRRFIGDAARDLASQLPGQWLTSVQIFSHPSWQEDLVPWIWDSGELGRAIQSERIPYAATLRDAAHGTTLLFAERPGHEVGYLVGAFAPEGLEEGYADPHAPRSIVVPPFSGRAARAVADRFLPAYEQALHARRTAAIAAALESIRADYGGWQAVVASGRSSDATPLSVAALGAASEEFLDNSWRSFLTVVDHAPPLLVRCHPASSPWPADAETLSRLADAVIAAEDLGVEVTLGGFVAPRERRARAWPAIETWLADGETFLRQARVSAPHRRPALPISAPIRSLAAGRSR